MHATSSSELGATPTAESEPVVYAAAALAVRLVAIIFSISASILQDNSWSPDFASACSPWVWTSRAPLNHLTIQTGYIHDLIEFIGSLSRFHVFTLRKLGERLATLPPGHRHTEGP